MTQSRARLHQSEFSLIVQKFRGALHLLEGEITYTATVTLL